MCSRVKNSNLINKLWYMGHMFHNVEHSRNMLTDENSEDNEHGKANGTNMLHSQTTLFFCLFVSLFCSGACLALHFSTKHKLPFQILLLNAQVF